MNGIVGAIYPMPHHFRDRLFDGKNKVFVKFLPHNSTKLRPRHKIMIYVSGGSRELVGEGTIVSVEFLTPEEVIAKYKDKLFLNEAEFSAYVQGSPSRPTSRRMLTLVLEELKKYSKPIHYWRPLTMAGQYLTNNEYNSLIQKNEK